MVRYIWLSYVLWFKYRGYQCERITYQREYQRTLLETYSQTLLMYKVQKVHTEQSMITMSAESTPMAEYVNMSAQSTHTTELW